MSHALSNVLCDLESSNLMYQLIQTLYNKEEINEIMQELEQNFPYFKDKKIQLQDNLRLTEPPLRLKFP